MRVLHWASPCGQAGDCNQWPLQVPAAIASAKREAALSFGDDRVLLERYILRPRHVEVQVGDQEGGGWWRTWDQDGGMMQEGAKVVQAVETRLVSWIDALPSLRPSVWSVNKATPPPC